MNMSGGKKSVGSVNIPEYMAALPATPNVTPSPCSESYMMGLADPCMAAPSCIPNGIPTNSLKAQTFSKGVFTGSTGDNTVVPANYNGTAFVTLKPFLGMVADQHGTFGAPVLASFSPTSSGTGTEGTTLNNVGAGSQVASFYTNSSYTEAQLVAGSFNWRLVSACLRARFLGSTMHDSGRMVGLVEPNHDDLSGLTAAQLLAFEQAIKVEFRNIGEDDWFEVVYNGPVVGGEFAWAGNETVATFPNIANAFMAIAVTNSEAGVVATPFSGEWEAYCNYEYIGPIVRGQTISFADPAGFSAAVSVAANFSKIQKETQADENPKRSFMMKAWGAFKKALAMSTPIVHGAKEMLGTVGEAIASEDPMMLLKLIPQLRSTISQTRRVAGPKKKKKKKTVIVREAAAATRGRSRSRSRGPTKGKGKKVIVVQKKAANTARFEHI